MRLVSVYSGKAIFSTFLLILSWTAFSQSVKKVLIIGIDGCRQDALEVAVTPNIDSLIANGFYSPDGLNTDVTKSGPGWSAALTGVWSDKHLVNSNDFSNNNYADYPSIFKYIEAYDSNLNTVSIAGWFAINTYIVQDDADYTATIGSDVPLGSHSAYILGNFDPDVTFLQFDDTDFVGHTSGFSPTNPAYIQEIENVDAHIGRILDSIKGRSNYQNEDWLIIVTTDHGGIGTTHGGNSIEERKSFMVVNGMSVQNQILLKDSMLVDTTMVYDYSNTPRTVDVAYTVMEHLCIPIDSSWEFAGKSLIQTCEDQCEIPENLSTSINNQSNATLSWEPVTNANGYVLSGAESGGSNYISVNVSGTSIAFNALLPQQSYEWQVASICDTVVSSFSDLQVFTLPGICNSTNPIFHSDLDSTSVTLNWTMVPDAVGYIISGRGIGNLNITKIHISNPTATSFNVTGLFPGINYEWSVQAICNLSDTSAYAPIDSFTTPANSSKQELTTFLDNAQKASHFTIHPNPGKDFIDINITKSTAEGPCSLEVYNSTGEIVFWKAWSSEDPNILINTNEWSSGIYFIRYRNWNHSMIRKLVLVD